MESECTNVFLVLAHPCGPGLRAIKQVVVIGT